MQLTGDNDEDSARAQGLDLLMRDIDKAEKNENARDHFSDLEEQINELKKEREAIQAEAKSDPSKRASATRRTTEIARKIRTLAIEREKVRKQVPDEVETVDDDEVSEPEKSDSDTEEESSKSEEQSTETEEEESTETEASETDADDKQTQTNNRITELEAELRGKTKDLQTARKREKGLQARVTELNQRLEALARDNENLIGELNAAGQDSVTVATQNKETVRRLTQQIDQATAEKEKAESDLKNAEQVLQSARVDFNEKLQKLKGERDSARQEAKDLSKQLQKLQKGTNPTVQQRRSKNPSSDNLNDELDAREDSSEESDLSYVEKLNNVEEDVADEQNINRLQEKDKERQTAENQVQTVNQQTTVPNGDDNTGLGSRIFGFFQNPFGGGSTNREKEQNAALIRAELEMRLENADKSVTTLLLFPEGISVATIDDDRTDTPILKFIQDSGLPDIDGVKLLSDAEIEKELQEKKSDLKLVAVLKVLLTRPVVAQIIENLVQPLFRAWATEGGLEASVGLDEASLHTNYWIFTVVPILTDLVRKITEKTTNTDNSSMERLHDFVRKAVNFILIKGLTGNEAGSFDDIAEGSTQKESVRARAIFDKFDIYSKDSTVKKTLGNQKKTRNQLLRFDANNDDVKKDKRLKTTKADNKRKDGAKQVHGVVSAPLLKMSLLVEVQEGAAQTFFNQGKRLFDIKSDANGLDSLPVNWSDLVNDSSENTRTLTKNSGKYKVNRARKLDSLESLLSFVFGLPLLDAVYWPKLANLRLQGQNALFPVNQFSFQLVGNGFPEVYRDRLGILPDFFVEDTINVKDVQPNAMYFEKEKMLTLPVDGEETKKDRYRLRVSPLAGGEQDAEIKDDLPVPGTGTFDIDLDKLQIRQDEVLLQRAGVDDDLMRDLAFPAVVQQIANLVDVYSRHRLVVTDPVRTFADRLIELHKIVAAALFVPVQFRGDEEAKSLFQRHGKRPRLPIGPAEERFLSSDAAATVSSEFKIRRPRFTLPRMAKAISNEEKRKFDIGIYRSFLREEQKFGAELVDELNSGNSLRTVLVPTDEAVQAFLASNRVKRLSGEARDRFVLETLLYHTLIGDFDLEKILRRSPTGVSVPTALTIKDDAGRLQPVSMQLKVVKFDSDEGGQIQIDNSDERALTSIPVSAERRARNGRYYIVGAVADINVSKLRTSNLVNQFDTRGAELPPPIAGTDFVDVDPDRQDVFTGARFDASGNDYVRRLQAISAADIERATARAENICSKLLTQSRAKAAKTNEADFKPWRRFLKRTGVLADIKDAARDADAEPLHIYAPTPTALQDANVDLATASAALAQAHVAIGVFDVPSADDEQQVRQVRTAVSADELHYLMQRDKPTKLDTLHSRRQIKHMPHGSAHRPDKEASLFVQDVEFREPALIYQPTGAKQPVYVHFVNRVLHQSANETDSLPAAKSSGVKQPAAKPGGAKQPAAKHTGAKVTTSESAAQNWLLTAAQAARALASTKDSEQFGAELVELNTKLDQIGGADTLLNNKMPSEVHAHLSQLRSAVARNHHVDAMRKAAAHRHIDDIADRFPAN